MTAHQLSVCLALNQIVQFHLLYISQRNRSAVVSKDKSNENAEIGSCDPSLWLRKQVDEKDKEIAKLRRWLVFTTKLYTHLLCCNGVGDYWHGAF